MHKHTRILHKRALPHTHTHTSFFWCCCSSSCNCMSDSWDSKSEARSSSSCSNLTPSKELFIPLCSPNSCSCSLIGDEAVSGLRCDTGHHFSVNTIQFGVWPLICRVVRLNYSANPIHSILFMYGKTASKPQGALHRSCMHSKHVLSCTTQLVSGWEVSFNLWLQKQSLANDIGKLRCVITQQR